MRLMLIFAMILLSGCGVAKQLSNDCGGDAKAVCNALFGPDDTEQQDAARQAHEHQNWQDQQLGILASNLDYYYSSYTALADQVLVLDSELTALQHSLAALVLLEAADVSGLQQLIDALQAELSTQNAQLTATNANITSMLVAIAQLQGYQNIVEAVNPCGAQSAHDEVLLRLANGQILASFSDTVSGQNTRFSIIGSGSYITTDGTNCYFNISEAGVVTW